VPQEIGTRDDGRICIVALAMLTYLIETATKLQAGPPAERLTPSILRRRAAFQEAVVIEQEL
jgi:hypothetical protein